MNATLVVLPKTWSEIKVQFPGRQNKGLRDSIYRDCQYHGRSFCRDIALTASGKACIEAVNAVSRSEFHDLGFDRVVVGEGDPSVYGPGAVVAYPDQPVSA